MVFDKLKGRLPARTSSDSSKGKTVVALDVGTEYVKALIAEVNGDELEIIGVGRAHQSLNDMQSGAISDIAGVVENCDKALTEAERMAGTEAEQAVIGIAGELVKGTTRTVRYRRASPETPLAREEMERIIDRIQDRAYENARKSVRWELGNKDVDIRLVNSALVGMEIDGYAVTNPLSFQGREVAVQLYTAYAPLIHIGALERTAQELELDLIAVAAEPFAVARSVIGTESSSNLSAILIDVGGGTTDIAVVDEGGVEGTKMFGIGGRGFTRTIASEADVDFATAEKLKLAYGTPKLPKQFSEATNRAIAKTLDVWLNGVALALGEFTHLDHLPHHILLCGGGSSLEPLMTALEERDWYRGLPFTKKPTVQHIQPKQVVGIVDKTDTIHDHTYITAMGLLRVALDTDDAQPDARGTLKAKLDKILSI